MKLPLSVFVWMVKGHEPVSFPLNYLLFLKIQNITPISAYTYIREWRIKGGLKNAKMYVSTYIPLTNTKGMWYWGETDANVHSFQEIM